MPFKISIQALVQKVNVLAARQVSSRLLFAAVNWRTMRLCCKGKNDYLVGLARKDGCWCLGACLALLVRHFVTRELVCKVPAPAFVLSFPAGTQTRVLSGWRDLHTGAVRQKLSSPLTLHCHKWSENEMKNCSKKTWMHSPRPVPSSRMQRVPTHRGYFV
jgi:hypothetical protein